MRSKWDVVVWGRMYGNKDESLDQLYAIQFGSQRPASFLTHFWFLLKS